MDGWIDVWTDEWINGWMDRLMDRYCRWMERQDRQTDGYILRMGGWMDGKTNGLN